MRTLAMGMSFLSLAGFQSPPVNLFLHLDKSIYQPGETVWFTGYVLNRDEDLMRDQNTLYTMLVDAVNRKPVLRQRFLIKNGFGKGFLSLPDSLAAGDYWVMAYTNAYLEHGAQPVFRQLIRLRVPGPSPFRITQTTTPPATPNDSIRVRYKISTAYQGLAAGGQFSYTLLGDTEAIGSGVQTIDAFGEVTVPVDGKRAAGKNLEILAKVTRNGLSKGFALPVKTAPAETANADRFGASDEQIAAIPHGPFVNQEEQASFAIHEQSLPPPVIPHSSRNTKSRTQISIDPDSTGYHPHSKVTLRIHVHDSAGHPIPAMFSLAVVSSRKVDTSSGPSITDYADGPEPATTIEAAANSQPRQSHRKMPDYGFVLYDGKAPKQPVSLALMGNNFSSLTTDSNGRFELPYDLLVAPVGGVNYLSVADKAVDRYTIHVYSYSDPIDQQLAATWHRIDLKSTDSPDPDETDLASDPDQLPIVRVNAKMPAEFSPLEGEYRSTHCQQDFVCTHRHSRLGPDILNCPHQTRNPGKIEKPAEGKQYFYISDTNRVGHRVVPIHLLTYHCAAPTVPPFMKALQPILLQKKFPLQDSCVKHTLGSGLQSTVYWNHALTTDEKGDVTVSFYTNELTGNFTCILQGVSSEGVISKNAVYPVHP